MLEALSQLKLFSNTNVKNTFYYTFITLVLKSNCLIEKVQFFYESLNLTSLPIFVLPYYPDYPNNHIKNYYFGTIISSFGMF